MRLGVSSPTNRKMEASALKTSSASVPARVVEDAAAASACVPSARVLEHAPEQSLVREAEISSSESLNRLCTETSFRSINCHSRHFFRGSLGLVRTFSSTESSIPAPQRYRRGEITNHNHDLCALFPFLKHP